MIDQRKKFWLFLVIRGLLAISLGILLISGYFISIKSVIVLFGLFTLVGGCFIIINGVINRGLIRNWGLGISEGITELLIGSLILSFPEYANQLFMVLIASWAFLIGLFQLITAYELRSIIKADSLLTINGVVSIVLGLSFLINPLLMLSQWVVMAGALITVIGIILISLALWMKYNISLSRQNFSSSFS
jgi:uncharacterized membrane protein HdeD (DUF308 family)